MPCGQIIFRPQNAAALAGRICYTYVAENRRWPRPKSGHNAGNANAGLQSGAGKAKIPPPRFWKRQFWRPILESPARTLKPVMVLGRKLWNLPDFGKTLESPLFGQENFGISYVPFFNFPVRNPKKGGTYKRTHAIKFGRKFSTLFQRTTDTD